MSQFALFDDRVPQPSAEAAERTKAMLDSLPLSGPPYQCRCTPLGDALQRGDVLRIIQHKAGPFRELRDGQPTGREFRILELRDGRFVHEFNDGERQTSPHLTAIWIEDGIQNGTFVEVRA